MGTATTCSLLGILEKCGPSRTAGAQQETVQLGLEKCGPSRTAGAQQETVQLGLTGAQYKVVAATQKAEKFLQACRDQEAKWQEAIRETDFGAALQRIHAIVHALAVSGGGVIHATSMGYVRLAIVRKLFLGCVQHGAVAVDWAQVDMEALKGVVPDENGFLDAVPASWSAADLSRFVFSRDDWALFVPMFACLWHEVVKAKRFQKDSEKDMLLDLVSSPAFADRARSLSRGLGHAVCPMLLVEDLKPCP